VRLKITDDEPRPNRVAVRIALPAPTPPDMRVRIRGSGQINGCGVKLGVLGTMASADSSHPTRVIAGQRARF